MIVCCLSGGIDDAWSRSAREELPDLLKRAGICPDEYRRAGRRCLPVNGCETLDHAPVRDRREVELKGFNASMPIAILYGHVEFS